MWSRLPRWRERCDSRGLRRADGGVRRIAIRGRWWPSAMRSARRRSMAGASASRRSRRAIVRRVKALEAENARLKKLIAEGDRDRGQTDHWPPGELGED